jgi:hypothetical protein
MGGKAAPGNWSTLYLSTNVPELCYVDWNVQLSDCTRKFGVRPDEWEEKPNIKTVANNITVICGGGNLNLHSEGCAINQLTI